MHKLDDDDMSVLIEFPEDVAAKYETGKKREGNQIRDTLGSAVREMVKLQKSGQKFPNKLLDRVKSLQGRDFENMSESEIKEGIKTIEMMTAFSQ